MLRTIKVHLDRELNLVKHFVKLVTFNLISLSVTKLHRDPEKKCASSVYLKKNSMEENKLITEVNVEYVY